MDRFIDIDSTAVLKTGSLPKTGGEFSLVALSTQHIDQILALQDSAFDALSEKEQAFLIKKGRDFFENHFAEGNIVLGIVHDNKLIAQSIILHPTEEHPKTGMVDMKLETSVDKVSVIQGVIVDTDYRGNRLMTLMIDAWLDIAQKQGRTHAIAEVVVDNFYSWSVFMKEGLRIDSMGTDPADGMQVYNIEAKVAPLIQKRLKPSFNKAAAKHSVSCPRDDLNQQKKLLSEGYKGVKYDAANDNIVFRPSKRPGNAPKNRI